MNEQKWRNADWPYDMALAVEDHLNPRDFMRMSLAFCKRISHLITDPRSQKVMSLTESWLEDAVPAEEVGAACGVWWDAYQQDDLIDAVDGNTHEAVEMLQHVGAAATGSASKTCCEAVGWVASQAVRSESREVRTREWRLAENNERAIHCDIIRNIVDGLIGSELFQS